MRLYRDYPVTFGILVGLTGVAATLFFVLRYPTFGDSIESSWAWIRFGVFTAVIFILAVTHFSSRHPSGNFWIVLGLLFVAHMILFVTVILYIRRLTALDYILCAPVEAIVLSFLIPRATHFLHGRKDDLLP